LSSGPATTEISALSLHDALPILEMLGAHLRVGEYAVHDMAIQWDTGALLAAMKGEQPVAEPEQPVARAPAPAPVRQPAYRTVALDRKSTRLNSSHVKISYAVFCL